MSGTLRRASIVCLSGRGTMQVKKSSFGWVQSRVVESGDMNRKKLQEMRYHQVRFRPIARRFDAIGELELEDDRWLINHAGDDGLSVKNVRTGHSFDLPYDYIHHFQSDIGGGKRGFLC